MVIKGNILYTQDHKTLHTIRNGCLVVHGGVIEKTCTWEEFCASDDSAETIHDYGNQLIIPGMVDLHLHASQFAFCGLGMDRELLDWLAEYAFPEEMKYADMNYAETAYQSFVDTLLHSPTTRACVFATIHKDSSLKLAELMRDAGFAAYIGKVNMDRQSPEGLCEDTARSLADTRDFIETVLSWNCEIKPIITPRFVPSCTDQLMAGLGKLSKEYHLPVQSHLAENPNEVELVKKLNSKAKSYGDAYDMFGLFGSNGPAVMAHCVYPEAAELELMKQNGVFVAHCANSNFSLASGIAPARKYLEQGINMGLGTDIAGGFSISMFRAIQDTISVSKLYWRLRDDGAAPLSFTEAFYLATMGGGRFFGKVGSFLPGYAADILVLDDSREQDASEPDLRKRLERLCYLADSDVVSAKYINGRLVMEKASPSKSCC
ncbi:MAG: guanine deaminase [Acetatifactor sp.]|nr:guanine deaminase [Acetatifactor sp.]